MHYLIYKITNRLNNKFYVGKHKTEDKDDDYFGSGVLLDRAIKKHGKKNFVKELLFECETEEEMNRRETDIVDEDFVARDDTYNVMLGGNGGWSYVNENQLARGKNHSTEHIRKMSQKFFDMLKTDDQFRKAICEKRSVAAKLHNALFGNPFRGKRHTDETLKKMRMSHVGKHDGPRNSQFGTCWITDGVLSKKHRKSDPIPTGWKAGRC